MRTINRIIWHCAATKEGVDVKMTTIRSWHINQRKWSDIGYHYVIELDGSVVKGRPVERPGAHTKGHNDDSIGICYVGGVDANGRPKDTRTPEQRRALYELTEELLSKYPGATIHGHNEFANKACPSFDAAQDWEEHTRKEQDPPAEAEEAKCPHCGEPIDLVKA